MRISQIVSIVFIVGLSLGATSVSFADDPVKTPAFKDVDANGDAKVDASEFKKVTAAGVKKTLAELDENKDGSLSVSEYAALDEDCE